MKMGTTRVRLELFSLGMLLLGGLVVVNAVRAQGGVSFTRRDFGVGVDPESITVGDFNGDGHQDLATANRFPSTVSILLGRGDGTFLAAQDVGVGAVPHSITVGDFNGDGHQDLATANLSNTVSILLGRGDGTFQAAQDFGVGSLPFSVIVGDFNGDGHQDVATANAGSSNVPSNTVSILLGRGDGTFQAVQDFEVGTQPVSIIVGDFNGDGHQDLATTNGVLTVSILLGVGDSTFQAAQDFGVGTLPQSITVGDFNGDGQQDLATANTAADTVSILINNTSIEIAVKIDIKPGSFPNSINPKSNGVIPGAILTTDTFDATTVDPLSVRFGPRGAKEAHNKGHLEDVNKDKRLDLVLHFRTQATGIKCGDTSASLTGETFEGDPIEGTDTIKTVGCKK
jgi:hypothetical protein